MKTFIQAGNTVTVPAPEGGVVSGQGVLIGDLFGVAAFDAAAGEPVELALTGVYRLPKSSASIDFGQAVDWLESPGALVAAAGGTKVGVALEDVGSSAATVAVRISGQVA